MSYRMCSKSRNCGFFIARFRHAAAKNTSTAGWALDVKWSSFVYMIHVLCIFVEGYHICLKQLYGWFVRTLYHMHRVCDCKDRDWDPWNQPPRRDFPRHRRTHRRRWRGSLLPSGCGSGNRSVSATRRTKWRREARAHCRRTMENGYIDLCTKPSKIAWIWDERFYYHLCKFRIDKLFWPILVCERMLWPTRI